MKLLFVSSYHYPARPAQFKHGLIMAREYAAQLGKEFLYLTLYVKDNAQLAGIPYRETAPRLPLRQLRLISLYYFFYLGLFFFMHGGWRGGEVAVTTQESKLAFLLLIWKRFYGFNVVYECHGLHSPLTDGYVCRNADAVIFVTKRSEEEARRKHSVKRSVLLPNAVDVELFDAANAQGKAALRRELDLPTDKTLVGYVGRFKALGFDKGIEAGLRVLKEIPKPDVAMCFVGGTEAEIREFAAKAKELGVEDRALFVGFQPDARRVAEYTAAMDILIYLPPPEKFFTEETSPMKLFEYMAARRPIVVSDFSSMREILDEQSAVFVDPLGYDEIAKRIMELLELPEKAAQLAGAAYQKIQGNSWHGRAKAVLQVL